MTEKKISSTCSNGKPTNIDHELGVKPKDGISETKNGDLNTGGGGGGGGGGHGISVDHPTSYTETIMHLFKGNIGPGLFAMGDAFKNAGLIAAPIMTLLIALFSVHCQHILLRCSKKMQDISKMETFPDFAETVELCFINGPQRSKGWSTGMRIAVNIFICVTQLGFCCIYFVFISTNLKQVLDHHDIVVELHILMMTIFLPILLPSLITNLKYLAPISVIANICMISGITITMYYAFKGGLPSPTERNFFTNGEQLALYFGTAIFAFEGIALVLPLKNSMLLPKKFDSPLGVLNVGMTAVSSLFIFAGFLGYLKWGEGVEGSLTLNLDPEDWLAQLVKITVSLGVLLGYPLQLFVAIQIMWPTVCKMFKFEKNLLRKELVFRTIMVIVTFGVAELVPKLNLFISLIGALCSTALALVFPPIIDLIVSCNGEKGPGVLVSMKNVFILLLGLLGFSTGSYESITSIVREFTK